MSNVTVVVPADALLADLLCASATGDVQSFMRFYDATSRFVFALERVRAVSCGIGRREVRASAERATQARFVQAWSSAADQAASGLSPLSWLLALRLVDDQQEFACA
jgi:hypothetical protein